MNPSGLLFHKSTAFVSPSSYLLNKMAHSDLLNPSRCYTTTESDLDTLIDPARNRNAIVYGVHRNLARVIRLVSSVAIYTIVSPLGVVYHSTAYLYNKKIHPLFAATPLTNDDKAIMMRHLVCLKAEAARTAMVVSFVGSFYLLGVISRISEALSDSLGVLLMIPVGLSFNDLFIEGVENGSRKLDALNYADNLATLGLRRVLGLKCENTTLWKLKSIRIEAATKMLDQLAALQRLLPSNSRLPYGENLTDTQKASKTDLHSILTYLEEARRSVTSENWKEIVPHREALIRYSTLVTQLGDYLDDNSPNLNATKKALRAFPCTDDAIRNAYCQTGEEIPERPLKPQQISPVITRLFKRILVSNWLNPSQASPQIIPEDKGSLRESFAGLDLKLSQRSITNKTNYAGIVLRWVARLILTSAAVCVAVPGGVLYHGVQKLNYRLISVIGSSDESYRRAELSKAHSKAAVETIAFTITGRWSLLPFSNNEEGIGSLPETGEIEPLAVAALLRKKYGITLPNGDLPSYNPAYDNPENFKFNPVLNDLRFVKSLELFNICNDELFPEFDREEQGEFQTHFGSFAAYGTSQELIDFLDQIKNYDDDGIEIPMDEKFATARANGKRLIEELVELHKLNVEVKELVFRETKRYNSDYFKQFENEPYYSLRATRFSNKPTVVSNTSALRQNLNYYYTTFVLCLNQRDEKPIYTEFKNNVRNADGETPAAAVLGLPVNYKDDDVKKAYRKFSLAVHPDKVADAFKAEADTLFKILSAAKVEAEANLGH